jgi:predicted TIM-barrel fold metal-dependent hydrolase
MEEPEKKARVLETMDWIGWDRLLFATDYPHWDYDDPSQVLPPGVGEQRRRDFFLNNAWSVYACGGKKLGG